MDALVIKRHADLVERRTGLGTEGDKSAHVSTLLNVWTRSDMQLLQLSDC
jgi:hypothetical protein